MPNMDGFELYREMKEKDPDIKVCFLTASELYYEEFRDKEFSTLDKELFIRKLVRSLIVAFYRLVFDQLFLLFYGSSCLYLYFEA
jgi:CheY-like chemotaxis protein